MTSTKQTPPFYANRDDGMSCMLACMRSALESITGKQYTWQELEELTGFKNGIAAWTVKAWQTLAAQGIDVQMHENFDYPRYYKEGESYLSTFLSPTELEWQLTRTNLLQIRPQIPAFLQTVQYHQHSPQLADIDAMLNDGYLVTVQLNSDILKDKDGYIAHMILVYDRDGDEYIAHDPGLPPVESRRITRDKIFKAMGGPNNTVEVTGLRAARG